MATGYEEQQLSAADLGRLLSTLNGLRSGDLSVRMIARGAVGADVADGINGLIELYLTAAADLEQLAEAVAGGDLHKRAGGEELVGDWARVGNACNAIVATFSRHATELRRCIKAAHQGDFDRTVVLGPEGTHRGGDLQRLGEDLNDLMVHLEGVTNGVSRVAGGIALDGKFGEQLHVPEAAGAWGVLVGSLNAMTGGLAEQFQGLTRTAEALAQGDLDSRVLVVANGHLGSLKDALNLTGDVLSHLVGEFTRALHELGRAGRLGGVVHVEGARGAWLDLTLGLNTALDAVTQHVRGATKTLAVAAGGKRGGKSGSVSNELAALHDQSGAVTERLRAVGDDVERVLLGEFLGRAPEQLQGDALRMALHTLSGRIEEQWAAAGVNALEDELRGCDDAEAVAGAALSLIAPYTGATLGALYLVAADASLERAAGYAFTAEDATATRVGRGVGLLGQAAIDGQTRVITDLPAGSITARSGLLEVSLQAMAVVPISDGKGVVAVLELAFVDRVRDAQVQWLEGVAPTLAAALRNPSADAVAVRSGGAASRALKEQLAIASARNRKLLAELRARGERIDLLTAQLQPPAPANDVTDAGTAGAGGEVDAEPAAVPQAETASG